MKWYVIRCDDVADTQSGLHSEVCDIDYKLHAIIAGRKRSVIQSIQEETATNIYFPTQLVGVLNPPLPGTSQGIGYRTIPPQPPMPPVQMHPQMIGHSMPVTNMNGMNGMNGPNRTGMNPMNGFAPQFVTGFYQYHRNSPPAYNPHLHVQLPYQPHPMDVNVQATRGLPYTGPGTQHYAFNNSFHPIQPTHTGISMQSSFQQSSLQPSRIGSPMPSSHMGSPTLSHPVNQIDQVMYPNGIQNGHINGCLLYTSPSPRDGLLSRMPSSA